MTQRDALLKAAKKQTNLAFVYAEDGAFATAAKLLREAADLMEQELKRRESVLQGIGQRRS